jgi:SAM-dependent methyltransferase
MIRLDIGCRTRRRDVIGIDPFAVPGTGVRADLDSGLPFKDSSVDEVYAYHVLESCRDLMAALEEIWRVCKEGSLVYIRVPHASSSYVTWVDPSHRRGMTIETFNSLGLFQRARFVMEYARLRFITGNSRAEANPLRRLLASVVDALANHNRAAQYRCERWWGQWIGFDEVFVIIRAEKETRPPSPPGPRRRRIMAARRTP